MTIEYKKISGIDKKVSQIFYGTAADPFFSGEGGEELLDEIYALGVNAFDTARVYKLSEKALGTWIDKRGIREDVVVLSKCAHHDEETFRKRLNEKEIREDLCTSLELLKTDYIDIYLMHRDDTDVPVGKIAEIFNALYEEGKIKCYGGSNWSHKRIEEINNYANAHGLLEMSVSSPNFGLAEQVTDLWGGGAISISGPDNKEAREWYISNQMPVVAYSSLGRGFFSGKLKSTDEADPSVVLDEFAIKGYVSKDNFKRLKRCEELAKEKGVGVSDIAMAWLYRQPLNTFAIVSTSKAARMRNNINAISLELTQDELSYLDLRIN